MTDADYESHSSYLSWNAHPYLQDNAWEAKKFGERYCVHSKFEKDAIRGLSASDSYGCAQTDDF